MPQLCTSLKTGDCAKNLLPALQLRQLSSNLPGARNFLHVGTVQCQVVMCHVIIASGPAVVLLCGTARQHSSPLVQNMQCHDTACKDCMAWHRLALSKPCQQVRTAPFLFASCTSVACVECCWCSYIAVLQSSWHACRCSVAHDPLDDAGQQKVC